jgi:hypothetical protein
VALAELLRGRTGIPTPTQPDIRRKTTLLCGALVTPDKSKGLDPVRIGIVSISDRASGGVYEDKGLPALQDWLSKALRNPLHFEPRLIPDEQALISQTLIELVDAGCAFGIDHRRHRPLTAGRHT